MRSPPKMIVVTEAWVRCEIDLTYIFLVFSLIKVRLGQYQLETCPNQKSWFIVRKIGNDLTIQNYRAVCVCVCVCV